MFFTVRVVSEAEYAAHIAELRRNGQEGQLPRGILDTAEDRERAYNLKGSYATESDHSTPAPQENQDTEPAQDGTENQGSEEAEGTESEPANDAPDEEREALEASIRATEQQVEAEPLAPNQRRGHVSWLDRVKHLLNR